MRTYGNVPVAEAHFQRSNRAHPLSCAKCQIAMLEIVSIAPTLGVPGLLAYERPRCGHLTSVLEEG